MKSVQAQPFMRRVIILDWVVLMRIGVLRVSTGGEK